MQRMQHLCIVQKEWEILARQRLFFHKFSCFHPVVLKLEVTGPAQHFNHE